MAKVTSTQQSHGFGDTIAKMTKAVGIKPCGGCKKRQEYLNEKFPYKRKEQGARTYRLKDDQKI